MEKWKVFRKREEKIQNQLSVDELLYGNRVFIKTDSPSLWEKIKCFVCGGSPYIRRIDPTKLCIWHDSTFDGFTKYGKSIVEKRQCPNCGEKHSNKDNWHCRDLVNGE